MKKVKVYRLWKQGHWDTTEVEVPDEPWTAEAVEARAVTEAWKHFLNLSERPVRMGLFTVIDGSYDVAHESRIGPTNQDPKREEECVTSVGGLVHEVEQLNRQIEKHNQDKEDAVANQDFERAACCRDQADKLKAKRRRLESHICRMKEIQ